MAELPSPPELPKRFYKDVTVVQDGDSFSIHLDGRPVRTPARTLLAVPQSAVADAVAKEWDSQGTHIVPTTMPVTRLVNTVLDGVAPNAVPVREELERYAETDLLMYRAASPDRLVARQREGWDPIVAWTEQDLGVRFVTGEGVMHVQQPAGTIAALRARLASFSDPFRLAGVHQITTLTGSLLLAQAVAAGRLTADEAWALAHVDEDWNIELWGADEEAAARRKTRHGDMRAAALLLGYGAGAA